MSNLNLWKTVLGLDWDDRFVDLPVSPHYWKPTTLSVSLFKGVKIVHGVSHGEYNGEMEIDMSALTQNKAYTVALEWYEKDAWLFNRSNFSTDGKGLELHHLPVQKHTHEQNKTHLIYYHTLTIQFTKSVSGNATLIIKFEIGYPLPATYPDPLKNKTFLVLYGVEGRVEQVADVYDDHPVIHSSHTTTDTVTTPTVNRQSSPKSHGIDKLRPLSLSCNLTKSVYVNPTIMKTLAYQNEETLIECNPIQFYSLRTHLVDILDETLTEWDQSEPELNHDSRSCFRVF